jgi:hypothetical protein
MITNVKDFFPRGGRLREAELAMRPAYRMAWRPLRCYLRCYVRAGRDEVLRIRKGAA